MRGGENEGGRVNREDHGGKEKGAHALASNIHLLNYGLMLMLIISCLVVLSDLHKLQITIKTEKCTYSHMNS